MNATNAIDEIEERLVPKVRAGRDELAARFPSVHITVEAHPYRDRDGYELAISCVLPDKTAEESDLVELEIGFIELKSTPKVLCADVVWGHSSGRLEAALFGTPVPLTASVWSQIEVGLPDLLRQLGMAIQRGQPTS